MLNENIGFGQANNIGLKYALMNNYDYVYLLNQDAYLEPDTIEILIDILKNNVNLGIISPMQINENGEYDRNFEKCIPKEFYINQKKEDYYLVNFVMAAHWLLPLQVLREIGGFNPFFFHYDEDCNFVDRVIYKGYNVAISPLVKAIHDRHERIVTKEFIASNDRRRIGTIILNPNYTVLGIVKQLYLHFFVVLKHSLIYCSLKFVLGYICGFKHISKMIGYRKKQITKQAFL